MARKPLKRNEDITSRIDEEDLEKLFADVSKGYENQRDRSDEILDNWDIYNCRLGERQFYNGTSQLAMPFVHDAIEARVTRFVNQIFPQSGRFVEVTTGEDDPPQATQALLETYVRKGKLRTRIVPALLRNGDVEGQYTVYVNWLERERTIQHRVKKEPTTDGAPNPAAEPVETIEEEDIFDAYPDVEVISDPDLVVLPATAESIEDALEDGGSVTVLRRWSKGKIKKLIADDEIDEDEGEDLIKEMMGIATGAKDMHVGKDQLDAAGIKERGKVCVVYETWSVLKIGKQRRLCRIYYGGEDRVLGVRLNPFWNDRCPVISAPVIKVTGAFKGKAPITTVSDLQILANDTINEAADTSHFSAMPIVMTDPLTNPQVETMTLGLAAVWKVNPQTTQIVEFPELWANGLNRALAIKDQIFQTMNVNPSMIPNQTGGPQRKRSQAEMAIEQQVDLLTTADSVTIVEESILTPTIQRYAEYDHQFRDKEVTVRVYGPVGEEINMEMVEPIQLNERFEFRWYGVESTRNANQVQQAIAALNVVKQMGQASYPNHDLDLAPAVVQLLESTMGPREAAKVFKRKKFITVDPLQENDMMIEGFHVPVHPADDDLMHMVAVMAMIQETGDPLGLGHEHAMLHQQQMMQKAMGQQQAQQPQGGGGSPAKGPQPGAQPGQPHAAKQPPGAMHKDSMAQAGAVPMPRKAA